MYYKVTIYFLLIIFISLFSCNESKGIENMLSYNCSQCPHIKENQDTLDFINEVRTFVASNTDIGFVENELCYNFHKTRIEKFDVDTFLNIFENDEGVATCGLAGNIMVKILIENGINAYTYNFGFQNSIFTHIIVLVEFRDKLIIQDPFFNYELINIKDSLNYDFYEFIADIKMSKDYTYFKSDSIEVEVLLDFSKVDTSIEKSNICKVWLDEFKHVNNSIYKNSQSRCYLCDKANPCNSFILNFEEKLKRETDLQYFHEGFLLKINEIYGAKNYQEVNAKVDSLLVL